MALKPPSGKDLRRLQRIAEKIEQNEQYFQERHGDAVPGSVRVPHLMDAKAIRAVLSFVADYMRERR